jgi:hypothetical protein
VLTISIDVGNGGDKLETHIERVAMAFYYAEADEYSWDDAPELLKYEFRIYARDALALLTIDEGRNDDFLDDRIHARCRAA